MSAALLTGPGPGWMNPSQMPAMAGELNPQKKNAASRAYGAQDAGTCLRNEPPGSTVRAARAANATERVKLAEADM